MKNASNLVTEIIHENIHIKQSLSSSSLFLLNFCTLYTFKTGYINNIDEEITKSKNMDI